MSPRTRLTKVDVIQAAVRILNTEGANALTLNRLADDLGIRTPSLYNPVDGLPGLQKDLAVLNARLLADRLGEAAIGRSGDELFMNVAQAFRKYVKENPGLYLSTLRASGTHPDPDPDLMKEEERALKVGLAIVARWACRGRQPSMPCAPSGAPSRDLPRWKQPVDLACPRIAMRVSAGWWRLWHSG